MANELWQFLAVYDPYTSGTQLQGFGAQGAYTPNNIVTGDPIFYDISNRDGVMDHASIQVGIGTDASSGWQGNLVDEHSTNRRHVIWNLILYNSQWASTGTGERHVDG